MARHEFGIMETEPQSGKRYDEYEPEKYGCISVDDEYIEGLDNLCVFDSYCHTVDIPMKGLAYCGITLIPPTSVKAFLQVISERKEFSALRKLLLEAESRNKFVIHFGL